MMFRLVSLALWNVFIRQIRLIWRLCFVLITLGRPARGPIICDSSGCCNKASTDNTYVGNFIPIDRINNIHPLDLTYDACTCITRAHAGPELIGLDCA